MQSKQCPAELGAFSLGFHFINMVRMCQRGGGEVFILVLKRESAALLCIVSFFSLWHVSISCIGCIFPECVARVPVSLWGSGG